MNFVPICVIFFQYSQDDDSSLRQSKDSLVKSHQIGLKEVVEKYDKSAIDLVQTRDPNVQKNLIVQELRNVALSEADEYDDNESLS